MFGKTELLILPIAFLISLAIIVFTIYRTSKSTRISGDAKIVLYIMAVIAPIIGLILYFILDRNKDRDVRAV